MLKLTLALVAPLALAGVAHADPLPAGTARSAAATAPSKKPVRYCVRVQQETGTILRRQECRTREDWIARGVDPVSTK